MTGLSSQPRLGAGGARATTARHLDGLAKEAHERSEAVWRENAFEPLAHSDSEDVWAIQTNLIEEANLKEEDVWYKKLDMEKNVIIIASVFLIDV